MNPKFIIGRRFVDTALDIALKGFGHKMPFEMTVETALKVEGLMASLVLTLKLSLILMTFHMSIELSIVRKTSGTSRPHTGQLRAVPSLLV